MDVALFAEFPLCLSLVALSAEFSPVLTSGCTVCGIFSRAHLWLHCLRSFPCVHPLLHCLRNFFPCSPLVALFAEFPLCSPLVALFAEFFSRAHLWLHCLRSFPCVHPLLHCLQRFSLYALCLLLESSHCCSSFVKIKTLMSMASQCIPTQG